MLSKLVYWSLEGNINSIICFGGTDTVCKCESMLAGRHSISVEIAGSYFVNTFPWLSMLGESRREYDGSMGQSLVISRLLYLVQVKIMKREWPALLHTILIKVDKSRYWRPSYLKGCSHTFHEADISNLTTANSLFREYTLVRVGWSNFLRMQ